MFPEVAPTAVHSAFSFSMPAVRLEEDAKESWNYLIKTTVRSMKTLLSFVYFVIENQQTLRTSSRLETKVIQLWSLGIFSGLWPVLPLLFVDAFSFAIFSSASSFCSRNSCFFKSIFSVSRNFWMLSDVVGAGSAFLPPNMFLKKDILSTIVWDQSELSNYRLKSQNYNNRKLRRKVSLWITRFESSLWYCGLCLNLVNKALLILNKKYVTFTSARIHEIHLRSNGYIIAIMLF